MFVDWVEIRRWEREWANERYRKAYAKKILRRWHFVSAIVVVLEIAIPVFIVLK